ncbi:MAG: molybdate ABC transporter substrate-binding protein [Armatimonadota bacterium]|nr:MAG: molybdate ABC transporter substrate-binding protein [Armatimonadota bacterium]
MRLIAFVGAASKPPTTEAKEAFEQATPNIVVDISFGGSGTLLNQMTLEETGDIYMPGSNDYMDKAEEKNAVAVETRKIVAYLIPMICVQHGNPKNIQSLKDLARPGVTVGLAKAGAVCLGDVADGVLRGAGLEEEVKKNVITYAGSCDQTQQLVQLGEVDAVIGWDAFKHWAPDEIDVVPIAREHLQVRNIPAAISTYAEHREAAQQFIDFLTSKEGKEIFSKHGYSVTPPQI